MSELLLARDKALDLLVALARTSGFDAVKKQIINKKIRELLEMTPKEFKTYVEERM